MKAFYKLCLNGILLLALLLATDRTLGKLIEHYFFNEKQGDSAITTHALLHAKEDILIFGSSRASHHYIPELIRRKTGLSCYNLGRDGMKMKYYETLLKAVLSYHTPKIVILDLNINDFEVENNEEERLTTVFMPYINKNKEVHDLIYKESKKDYSLANISTLYRVNSLPVSILQHHLGMGQKHFNGYEPLVGKMHNIAKARHVENNHYKESEEKLAAFENFVEETQRRNIKLYVMVSPDMKTYKHNSIQTANQTLNKYKLRAYDYSELFKPDAYDMFYDGAHLNDAGAKAFTSAIIAAHLQ
ncbi:uncharacterized protein DUF1574 [Arcticibacter pallidicorallinus]|uniref:Uncharacterized protein DUF1574 n=1 Tax=Arcticibacter pallidicorallinus TaxID=1259464 RepID=A0A2T0TYV1_9SPHI|nr:SGNH/GDSL hydrolase family protein [Arcticibacter pallidicorallinus]PRY50823.1 uncharacterized protein DUF1574 [Arcticibacter pallidicorallinus]